MAYQGNAVFLQTPVTTGGPGYADTPRHLPGLGEAARLRHALAMAARRLALAPLSFVNYGLLLIPAATTCTMPPSGRCFVPVPISVLGAPPGNDMGTHGCANVPYSAEVALYNWAPISTPVIV